MSLKISQVLVLGGIGAVAALRCETTGDAAPAVAVTVDAEDKARERELTRAESESVTPAAEDLQRWLKPGGSKKDTAETIRKLVDNVDTADIELKTLGEGIPWKVYSFLLRALEVVVALFGK